VIPEFLLGLQDQPALYLFLFCAASGIAFPLPEDVSLLMAGISVSEGKVTWPVALGVAVAGVMVRDLTAYTVGRLLGDWILSSRIASRVVGRRKLARARRMIERRGAQSVLMGRFLVGVRATVFFAAGAGGVPLRKFVLWNALGLMLTVPPVILLGYEFGQPLVDGALWMIRRGRAVTLMIVALFAAAIWLRAQQRTAEPETTDPQTTE